VDNLKKKTKENEGGRKNKGRLKTGGLGILVGYRKRDEAQELTPPRGRGGRRKNRALNKSTERQKTEEEDKKYAGAAISKKADRRG